MKRYIFYRESEDFSDILTDPTLKKHIDEKVTWNGHLRIGLSDRTNGKLASYITLKYGDELRTNLTTDYSPIIGVDYIANNKA